MFKKAIILSLLVGVTGSVLLGSSKGPSDKSSNPTVTSKPKSAISNSLKVSLLNIVRNPTHKKFGVGLPLPDKGYNGYPASDARDAFYEAINPNSRMDEARRTELINAMKNKRYPRGLSSVEFEAPVVISSTWTREKNEAKQFATAWADALTKDGVDQQKDEGRRRPIPYGETLTDTPYQITNGRPINPMGLTGITGRGELGLWGANPAGDPCVFMVRGRKLYVRLIQRNEPPLNPWALPGGMIDATDSTLSMTAMREFKEEVGVGQKINSPHISYTLGTVYRGYSDDPRNTDNAWIETQAFVWLIKPGVPLLKTVSVDPKEIAKTGWIAVTPELLNGTIPLFASHTEILKAAVARVLDALNEPEIKEAFLREQPDNREEDMMDLSAGGGGSSSGKGKKIREDGTFVTNYKDAASNGREYRAVAGDVSLTDATRGQNAREVAQQREAKEKAIEDQLAERKALTFDGVDWSDINSKIDAVSKRYSQTGKDLDRIVRDSISQAESNNPKLNVVNTRGFKAAVSVFVTDTSPSNFSSKLTAFKEAVKQFKIFPLDL